MLFTFASGKTFNCIVKAISFSQAIYCLVGPHANDYAKSIPYFQRARKSDWDNNPNIISTVVPIPLQIIGDSNGNMPSIIKWPNTVPSIIEWPNWQPCSVLVLRMINMVLLRLSMQQALFVCVVPIFQMQEMEHKKNTWQVFYWVFLHHCCSMQALRELQLSIVQMAKQST